MKKNIVNQKVVIKNVAIAGTSIVADINGVTDTASLSNADALRYEQASDIDKPIVAMELACKTFSHFLAGHYAGEFMYQAWHDNDRLQKGVEDCILVNGPTKFFSEDEIEIDFDVHDGFAVSQYEGYEYLMVYPTMAEVNNNPGLAENVEYYVGQPVRDTGIWPNDIMLTFGKLVSRRAL